MKEDTTLTEELTNGNLDQVQKVLRSLKAREEDFGVLLLIADMLDEIAAKKQRYMIIGAVTNLSAFSLTVKGPKAPQPLYGPSLQELSKKSVHLL